MGGYGGVGGGGVLVVDEACEGKMSAGRCFGVFTDPFPAPHWPFSFLLFSVCCVPSPNSSSL